MRAWLGPVLGCLPAWALSMGLSVEPAGATCAPPTSPPPAPAEASSRIPDSQAVAGSKDIAWVWLGSPTRRYPHGALGSPVHAGSVHVLTRTPPGLMATVELSLPVHRVFEDRVPRLADLDGDGRDEIVLVEADALRGAALVVLVVGVLFLNPLRDSLVIQREQGLLNEALLVADVIEAAGATDAAAMATTLDRLAAFFAHEKVPA